MSVTDHLVVFAGQSNMVGHVKAIDGDKPENPHLHAWSNGGAAGAWGPAIAGQPPFNDKPGAPNNIALHFADHLQHRTGGRVWLVGRPVNGSTLLSWREAESENMAALQAEVSAAMRSQAFPQTVRAATAFLWSQGESDDAEATMIKTPKLSTLQDYADGFARMVATLGRHDWFDMSCTAFVATEMVDNGWLSARNDFYRRADLWPADLSMTVASAAGLSDVGDGAHFSGKALQALGLRMFERWSALPNTLPMP